MKHVIRYLLEGNGAVPVFVEDGGYFCHLEEKVGISVDSSKRHVPAAVVRMTRAELTAHIEAHALKIDSTSYSTQEASDLADAFLAQRGMTDYQ